MEDGKLEKKKVEVGASVWVWVWDPLVVLGTDIMAMILGRLDACSLARSLLVSRRWHAIASSDNLWSFKQTLFVVGKVCGTSCIRLMLKTRSTRVGVGSILYPRQGLYLWVIYGPTACEELWRDKAHIPRSSQVWGLSKLAAYSISIVDGRRTRILKEDLCDHVWEFHFNEEAPEYWRNLDPYWKGTGPPMRRYFHPDGSLTADPGDGVWGGHESSYLTVTSFFERDGKIRDHYVRINRWPRMTVSRKDDWSWEMSNNLYVYSSIPDSYKEGGTGPQF